MTMRKKMMCSCYLSEFLELIESKIEIDPVTNSSNELTFVDAFLRVLEEEVVDVFYLLS